MKSALLACLAACIFVPSAYAQTISEVKFEPAAPKAGQPVNIIIHADKPEDANCGLRVDFGDGNDTKERIGSEGKTFPLTLTHTYAKAGTYEVRTEGKIVRGKLGCNGRVKAQLTIAEAEKKTEEKKSKKSNKKSSH